MKKRIQLSVLALFILHFYYAQFGNKNNNKESISYEVKAKYSRPVTKTVLNKANVISDLLPGYPKNWISNYTTLEIKVKSYNGTFKAKGKNDILTEEQKQLLLTLEPGTDVSVTINYQYNEPVSKKVENNHINVTLTVVPETQAEFIGGFKELDAYLKQNIISKISKTATPEFKRFRMTFTINEEGEVSSTKITNASGDPNADILLVELISKMPKWKPAENSNGAKVKQEFELKVGSGKEGC